MPSGEPPRRRVSTGKPRSSAGRGNVAGVASGWEGREEEGRVDGSAGRGRRATGGDGRRRKATEGDGRRREAGASSRRTFDAPLERGDGVPGAAPQAEGATRHLRTLRALEPREVRVFTRVLLIGEESHVDDDVVGGHGVARRDGSRDGVGTRVGGLAPAEVRHGSEFRHQATR